MTKLTARPAQAGRYRSETRFHLQPSRVEKIMNAKNHSSLQGLAHQQIVELPDRNADALICISGTLWVTAFGDSTDILLHAGERLSLRKKMRVVVQALGPARYRVVRHASYAGLLQLARDRYDTWLTQHPALR